MLGLDVYRTRFGTDIVAQFKPADKPSKKVAILLPGCPGYPLGKRDVTNFLTKKGFLTIVPSYRGTWESSGNFLEFPPSDDVEIIINQLETGFQDLWSQGEYQIKDAEVYLIGGSFGGAASILASRHPKVVKAVSLSGVVDWQEQKHTVEPLDFMDEYVPKAFGMGYRPQGSVKEKLEAGNFYSPLHEKESLDGKKLLLIHMRNDRVVHAEPARTFAEEVGAKYVEFGGDEHMGVSMASTPKIWRHIERHFKGK